VYFRDTAHGFLAWAVATLVAAMLILSTAGGLATAGAQAGASAVGAAASMAPKPDPNAYFVDSLFRNDGPAPVSDDAANGIAARIIAKSIAQGTLAEGDRAYLAQLVAQRTRLSQAEAEARVDQVFAQVQQAKVEVQQAADTAAKVAAWTALWTFVALLCGAFFASLAALLGGRQRDRVVWLEAEGVDYTARRTIQR
jgi:hypothetical protein